MTDCLFCKIIAGDLPSTVVHETETTIAFRDLHPQAAVHVLVVPKRHLTDGVELATEAPGLLADVLRAAGEVAKLDGIADSGYRMVFNTGRDGGQTVFHAHLHVLGGEQLGHFGKPYGG